MIVRYQLPGTLSIDVTPDTAPWTISAYAPGYTGPLSGTGDVSQTAAPAGSYTVDYQPLAGYLAPADQTLSVTATNNTAFSGTYTASAAGTLSIDVTPNTAAWRITSHPAEYTTPTNGTGDLAATAAEREGNGLFPTYTNRIGTVRLDKAGMHSLELRALKINPKARGGLTPSAVWLVPKGAYVKKAKDGSAPAPQAKLLKSVLA